MFLILIRRSIGWRSSLRMPSPLDRAFGIIFLDCIKWRRQPARCWKLMRSLRKIPITWRTLDFGSDTIHEQELITCTKNIETSPWPAQWRKCTPKWHPDTALVGPRSTSSERPKWRPLMWNEPTPSNLSPKTLNSESYTVFPDPQTNLTNPSSNTRRPLPSSKADPNQIESSLIKQRGGMVDKRGLGGETESQWVTLSISRYILSIIISLLPPYLFLGSVARVYDGFSIILFWFQSGQG